MSQRNNCINMSVFAQERCTGYFHHRQMSQYTQDAQGKITFNCCEVLYHNSRISECRQRPTWCVSWISDQDNFVMILNNIG